jgi:cAMP-dependent protein kinase regulator
MDLEIPVGLSDLLQDFTVHVLREKPEDIVDFAANYFMKLKLKEKRSKEGQKNKKGKGVSFTSEQNGGDMEDMDDDEDDDMPGISSSSCSATLKDVTASGQICHGY